MPTLIYTPQVTVYIQTDRNGTLDVSEDLTEGTLTRRSDGVSTFDFSIMNARRKYDNIFSPNDRIIVLMKRLTWLRVFTGYLNSVPLRTAWPREVPLSASCSLKRLQYYYWDPYASASVNLMRAELAEAKKTGQGATSRQIVSLLSNVVGWPEANVHLGEIPQNWFEIAVKIAAEIKKWDDEATALGEDWINSIGAGALMHGSQVDHLRSALGVGSGGGFGGGGVGAGPGGIVSTSTGVDPAGTNTDTPGSVVVPGSGTGAGAATGSAAGTLSPGKYGGINLSAAQCSVAERIFEVGISQPWGGKRVTAHDLIGAMCAAMGESAFNPHAANNHQTPGVSGPGGSSAYGVFQLLASHGTLAQRASVDFSSRWWFNQWARIFHGQDTSHYSPGTIALKVEVSGAGSGYYDQYAPMGTAILTRILTNKKAGSTQRAGGQTPSPRATPRATTATAARATTARTAGRVRSANGRSIVDTALRLVDNHPYIPYGAPGSGYLSQTPPSVLDCSSFVQWVVNRTLGSLGGCPRVSHDQAAWCRRIPLQQALNTPGALVFVSSNGAASGVHHVEISLGNGRQTVGAHHPGSPAGVEAFASQFNFGGLMPAVAYGSSVGAGAGPKHSGATGSPTVKHSGGHNVWPVPSTHVITTPFRKKGSLWSLGFHTGIDFGLANTGDTVVASSPGKVEIAGFGPESSYGRYVVIRSGNVKCLYAHLSMTTVHVGDVVAAGQKIGEVGSTGNTTGPHLHFEVRSSPYNFTPASFKIDPAKYITEGTWSTDSTTGVPTGTGDGTGLSGVTGVDATSDDGVKTVADSPDYDPNNPIDQLFAENKWYDAGVDPEQSQISASETGAYTLAHDSTVLQYVMNLCASSMRSFCSAPNGDFIGWFPDYYGLWGTAAILRVEAIEVQDFNITWSDDNFVTHQFVYKAVSTGFDPATGLASSDFAQNFIGETNSAGLANIDSPIIMSALFGFPPKSEDKFAKYIYKKFGARPNMQKANAQLSKNGELFMALYYFMLQWAYQYQASIPTTFMPEAWPGMLIQIPDFNFQAYITSVTHTFSFGEGGQFATSINIVSPAYMPSSSAKGKGKNEHAMLGLPLAGGYSDAASGTPTPSSLSSITPPNIPKGASIE